MSHPPPSPSLPPLPPPPPISLLRQLHPLTFALVECVCVCVCADQQWCGFGGKGERDG